MNIDKLTVREAARRRIPLDGANAQALEGALSMTERERDEARAEVERLRAEIEMLRGIGCREAKLDEPESGPCGVCLKCAEERGARWALERHGNPFATKTLAQYAEEICKDARGKT